MGKLWIGCLISESLHNPTLLNKYNIMKIRITNNDLPIDEHGTIGRWHMYWIECFRDQISRFEKQIKYSWYGHFWKDDVIIVVFEGKSFELQKNNKLTWIDAIQYGKTQHITEDMLDFVIDIEN